MSYRTHWRAAALVLACSVSLDAQQGVAVRGLVLDGTGAAVQAATVQLRAADGSVKAETVSSSRGEFTLPAVSPGSYVLLVPAASGLAETQQPVTVAANPTTVRLTLLPETVHQIIDVGSDEQPSTEASANQDSVAVSAATLDHLPVFDRDIVATLTPFLDPAATSSSAVSLIVDGMEMKNVTVTPSAIAEVRINSDPYSSEFASPGRGRLEISTKPGSPHYHGTLNVIARDAAFNARNYFPPDKPAEQRRIYEGHLIGPIGHGGHTTFLISGTRPEEDLQSAVHAVGTQGTRSKCVDT